MIFKYTGPKLWSSIEKYSPIHASILLIIKFRHVYSSLNSDIKLRGILYLSTTFLYNDLLYQI